MGLITDNDNIKMVEEAAIRYGNFMSPELYLQWERKQAVKHEFIDGAVVAMAGASDNHNFIQANIVGSLWAGLSDKPCRVVASDMKVHIESTRSFFYPDATVICENTQFVDKEKDAINNPVVIFEILSPSTAGTDLGRKLFFYMQVPSVKEIIFIDSTCCEVKIGNRQMDSSWKFDLITDLYQTIILESIEASLPMQVIYKSIRF